MVLRASGEGGGGRGRGEEREHPNSFSLNGAAAESVASRIEQMLQMVLYTVALLYGRSIESFIEDRTTTTISIQNKNGPAAAEDGRNPVSNHQIQLEYGDEQADAGRDCRNRLARPNSQARTETGKICIFPVQLTTSRIGNLTRLILTLATCDDHTYILWQYS